MSAEGETLDLIRVLRVRGNVEVWMGLVESAMFEVTYNGTFQLDLFIDFSNVFWIS